MKLDQISVNLHSLRDHLKTVDGFTTSIARLADIGFKSVQLSGVAPDLMPTAQFARICHDHGIVITSTHEPGIQLLQDPSWSIERLQILGVSDTAYPFPAEVNFDSVEQVDHWLGRLDEVANLMRAAGINLAYHNHQHEFIRLNDSLIYERIFDETSLLAELDTYWVQMGGGDPLAWTRRWAEAGRLPLLHLKDVRITPVGETRFGELGRGSLHFDPIILAAESGGCRSFIIEQDLTYERDTFQAIAESFQFLRHNFVSER
jgi:sugar phosphate isomerase/epimerase